MRPLGRGSERVFLVSLVLENMKLSIIIILSLLYLHQRRYPHVGACIPCIPNFAVFYLVARVVRGAGRPSLAPPRS